MSDEYPGKLLHQAVLYNNYELLCDLLGGEMVQWIDACDPRGQTAVHCAAAKSPECMKLLIDAGAEVNVLSHAVAGGKSPLHIACDAGNVQCVKYLVEAGADLFSLDSAGYCPLELAQKNGHDSVVNYVLGYFDEKTERMNAMQLELERACTSGDTRKLDELLKSLGKDLPSLINAMPSEQYTLLYRACERGQRAVVELLLGYGADGRIHPVTFYSPLYIAAYAGHNDIVEILLKKFPDLVQVCTVERWLPLHAVSRTGNLKLLQLFLTTSHYPLSLMQLYQHPAMYHMPFDVNTKDADDRTPLYLACSYGHTDIVRTLLDFSVPEVPSRTPTDSPERLVEPRMVKPVLLDVYSGRGRTALHEAVIGGFYDVVKLLLEHKADVNLPILAQTADQQASSALAEACRLGDAKLVDLLLQAGAQDVDHQALSACLAGQQQQHEALACRLLEMNVFNDPEYRINKKALDVDLQQHLSKGRTVIPSSLFPTNPVMINWHNQGLPIVKEAWLVRATLHLNNKLKHSSPTGILLSAITRIDLSKNDLSEIPLSVFSMVSMRVLNLSYNKIESLPSLDVLLGTKRKVSGDLLSITGILPFLEELHLHNNRLEVLPEWIFRLPALQAFDASNNRLKVLPSQLWVAPKLKDVNLSFNLLRQLPISSELTSRDSPDLNDSGVFASLPIGAQLSPAVVQQQQQGDSASLRGSPSMSSDFATSAGGESDRDSLTDVRFLRGADDTLSFQELRRHNLWQRLLEPHAAFNDEDHCTPDQQSRRSALSSLNLAHNLFDTMPDGLPCVAPYLARLNLANNGFRSMGAVNCYPAKLKHLDLSNNCITQWFIEPSGAPKDCDCFSVGDTLAKELSISIDRRSQYSPVLGRRAQSAVRGSRSMSVMSSHGVHLDSSVTGTYCVHRRHVRLENLRTLVLAGNDLDCIQLRVGQLEQDTIPVSVELASSGDAIKLRKSSANRPPPSSSQQHRSSRKSVSDVPMHASPAKKISRRVVFPSLSMLDMSNNRISQLPTDIAQLPCLSVLNLANNAGITTLPPELGMLSKLWNLNLTGCSLAEPLRSMMDSKKYKTLDIIGYLKSVLEDSKPYCRLKLMIVGVQGIGKTSILEQLRQEGTSRGPAEGWAKRMGHKDINRKTAKGVNISTVGVDVGDWTYEPKRSKQQQNFGPVTFRTWDFGGQREYYATHQYFLSKRSLFLVVWRVTDGEAGISEITQWLVNIQARAPNAPVVIVGTHFDEVIQNRAKFPIGFVEDLLRSIKERFMCLPDADKKGLPRVVDAIVVSCKTRHNIRVLANLIYATAYELRSTGSKERLLEQKIPASYLQLEEVVVALAARRLQDNKDPVLTAEQYRSQVQAEMLERFGRTFRDMAELNQATSFLHENGVVLHYEDATLKDLYFLDPQWLCDILAHVITIREINPFAKNGVMKTDDLKILFKSSKLSPSTLRLYILQLLQKFEVALTWDNRTLLIPSLLPDEYQLRGGYQDSEVKIPIKSRGWLWKARLMDLPPSEDATSENTASAVNKEPTTVAGRSKFYANLALAQTKHAKAENIPQQHPLPSTPQVQPEVRSVPIFGINRPNTSPVQLEKEFYLNCQQRDTPIRRLYLLAYFPSGFWSRLITRILSDEFIPDIIQQYFRASMDIRQDAKLAKILETSPEWLLWQSGLEVRFLNHTLFSLKEFLPLAEIRDVNYKDIRFKYHQDQLWLTINSERMSVMELYLPSLLLTLRYTDAEGKARITLLQTDAQMKAKLLSLCVDLIDTMLEDWYPSLGTRFVHTSEGRYLVTRLVPCPQCLIPYHKIENTAKNNSERTLEDGGWTIVSLTGETDGSDLESKEKRVPRSKTFDAGFVEGGRRRKGSNSSQDSGVAADSSGTVITGTTDAVSIRCISLTNLTNNNAVAPSVAPVDQSAYSFTIEECILAAHNATSPKCPTHGLLSLLLLAPDTVFVDLTNDLLVQPEQVKRSKMIGRGAFGFVFKAQVKLRGASDFRDVALKMLQPVDPGFGARQSAIAAYKAAWQKWQRDPMQYACRAYCTARQELQVLTTILHPQVVSLVGVCPRPLALIVALAPLGSLNTLLNNYRRSGARLHVTVVQATAEQVARALEYLHQQRLIYRDLKSENVLVWQFPPPFSSLITVQIRLGDYGISRSVLPTGGTKGFGGTEGFMAPEIMRYNGEEEYTEKVDCFSFGMFMFELLTLRLPFEGQEQVKEYILDGGRPQLTPRELLCPSNFLDLMVMCWSQQPAERPSASQIVSMTSAPEFAHLLDVVSLRDQDAAVLAGETVGVEDTSPGGEDIWLSNSEGEIWLSRADGQLSVLACGQHGWLDYKSLSVNEDSFVTCLCFVDYTLWLGELTGLVRVYCTKTYTEIFSFSLAPYLLKNNQSNLSGGASVKPNRLSLPVTSMVWLPTLHRVMVAAGQPAHLALCQQYQTDPQVLVTLVPSCRDVHCLTVVPTISSGCVEVWAGGIDGFVSALVAAPDAVKDLCVFSHYNNQAVPENAEVYQMLCSRTSDTYVWSYVYPGCILYQWNRADRCIMARLDCSKIAPCSESINTINIDERLSPVRCQVTSMCLMEREETAQLYVGTTWGVVIVAEADQLRPVTAFRPHQEEVRVIVPVCSHRYGLSYDGKSSAQRRTTSQSYLSTGSLRTSSQGSIANLPPSQSPGGALLTPTTVAGSAPQEYSLNSPLCYLVTVGKGYRCLLQRFLDSYREESEILESRNRDYFAALWRTEDWLSG